MAGQAYVLIEGILADFPEPTVRRIDGEPTRNDLITLHRILCSLAPPQPIEPVDPVRAFCSGSDTGFRAANRSAYPGLCTAEQKRDCPEFAGGSS